MSADPETGSAALPLSLERQLNAACDRFEAAWRAGTRPRIEDFLTDCPGPGRGALLAELLALELAYRARAGEAAAPEEYRTRFPAHEAAIRAAFGAPAPSAEHAARAGGMRDACGVVPTRRLAGAGGFLPAPGSPLDGFGTPWNNQQHVNSIGQDGKVHELWYSDSGGWQHNTLSDLAGANGFLPAPGSRSDGYMN